MNHVGKVIHDDEDGEMPIGHGPVIKSRLLWGSDLLGTLRGECYWAGLGR